MMKLTLVDSALEKYGIPKWMRVYIQGYVKSNSIISIKRATAFINVGRKKGAITKTEIILPNGTKFHKEDMLHLVSLFLYGEERISQISQNWAKSENETQPSHKRHFAEMSQIESHRARAIKNLLNGLGSKPGKPSEELVYVFDYIESLRYWEERMVAKKILLNYSFAKPFGYVFYKIFYPVSPEFMRSFGTAFNNKQPQEYYGEEEARRIIEDNGISQEKLIELTENVLTLTTRAINTEIPGAKRSSIEKEVVLLRDISIAYPLHKINELGVKIDVEEEVAKIKKNALKKKRND
ncbi:MAG: hypothetical protein ACHQX1_00095 [Candidatus Micrarchaeales archaeon]